MNLPLQLKVTALASLATLCLSFQTHAALVLQLQAADYNAGTGLWTADVGPNATAVGTPAALGTATANGSVTVGFTQAQAFTLATSLPAGTDYTVFVFGQISSPTAPLTVVGGGSNSFQYRIYQGKQDTLRQGVQDLGSSTTALTVSTFASFNATVSSAGGTYRLNGVTDGSTTAATFGNAIQYVGNNNAGGQNGEAYGGSIAEIRVYNTALTDVERQAVEAEFTTAYVVPEPSSWVMMLGGLGMLMGFQRVRSARA